MQAMSRHNLDKTVLRQFCMSMAIGFSVFFYLLLPWLFDFSHPLWALIIAGLFLALALINPLWSYPIYAAWLPFAHMMGWINSHILLGAVFYGLFVPIGHFMRWRNKLDYKTRYQPQNSSYFIAVNRKFNPKDMENPF